MAPGSWLKAHGSWPRKIGAVSPGPGPLSHEPCAMNHKPLIENSSITATFSKHGSNNNINCQIIVSQLTLNRVSWGTLSNYWSTIQTTWVSSWYIVKLLNKSSCQMGYLCVPIQIIKSLSNSVHLQNMDQRFISSWLIMKKAINRSVDESIPHWIIKYWFIIICIWMWIS